MSSRLPFAPLTALALCATLQVCACGRSTASSAKVISEVAVVTVQPQPVPLTTELPGRTSPTLVLAGHASAPASVPQLDPIYVDVALSASALMRLDRARDSGPLSLGADRAVRVGLKLADGSMYPLEGELRFSEIAVDPSTRMATLRAVFPNPMGKLLPGMFVRAVVDEGMRPGAILVPKPAVTVDGNGTPMAYVVGLEGKLEARRLVTERALGDRWVVTAGLKPGDRVVVEASQQARPGAPVNAVE